MEQGVEPIAQLIWAPRGPRDPQRASAKAPLREPPISADPLALRQRQEQAADSPTITGVELETLGLPSDLPQPLVLPEGETLPEEGTAERHLSGGDPVAPGATELQAPDPTEVPVDSAVGPTGPAQAVTTGTPLPGAPPPPPLPLP
jgi:hypothetical protein